MDLAIARAPSLALQAVILRFNGAFDFSQARKGITKDHVPHIHLVQGV